MITRLRFSGFICGFDVRLLSSFGHRLLLAAPVCLPARVCVPVLDPPLDLVRGWGKETPAVVKFQKDAPRIVTQMIIMIIIKLE